MNELLIVVISAILQGIMLMIGMLIGTRLSAKEIKRELRGMLEKSETAVIAGKLIKKLDELLANEEVTANAAKFFKAGTELLTSPEAKNFFKNVTTLMKDLSGEPKLTKLKLPDKNAPRKT